MRLGFHYHVPAIQKDGQIWMPGYLGRFVDSLAQHCDSIVCLLHTPRLEEEKLMDYPLQSNNVSLVALGEHGSLPNRLLHVQNVMRQVRKTHDQMDALLIRGPTPLLPWVAKAAGPVPISLLLVGDQLAGVDDLPQPGWRKEAIRQFWKWNTSQQLEIARNSLTFVNSHLLYKQLEGKVPRLVETRTTTLQESDFFVREDTCQQRPIHLLYTGRMDSAKGLLDMVTALSLLVNAGEDVILDLVGWPEKNSGILEEIRAQSQNEGVADRVIYHGYRPVGPELFEFYKQADIYVIASQSSEGFPRTIWEAMANGLPVVATRVGSIPDFIEGSAVLIEPKHQIELAQGISQIIYDPHLRKRNIEGGYSLSMENTIEIQSKKMVDLLIEWKLKNG